MFRKVYKYLRIDKIFEKYIEEDWLLVLSLL